MQQLPPFPDEPGQPSEPIEPQPSQPGQPERSAAPRSPAHDAQHRRPLAACAGHRAADNADLAGRLGDRRSWAEATIASKSGRVAP